MKSTIRVEHALRRLELLAAARESAAAAWRAEGRAAAFAKWKVLERKTARQRNKIAKALKELV